MIVGLNKNINDDNINNQLIIIIMYLYIPFLLFLSVNEAAMNVT